MHVVIGKLAPGEKRDINSKDVGWRKLVIKSGPVGFEQKVLFSSLSYLDR